MPLCGGAGTWQWPIPGIYTAQKKSTTWPPTGWGDVGCARRENERRGEKRLHQLIADYAHAAEAAVRIFSLRPRSHSSVSSSTMENKISTVAAAAMVGLMFSLMPANI